MSAAGRRLLERMVAINVIRNVLADGYAIGVHDGEEECLPRSTDAKAIFAAMCTTDIDTLLVYKASLRVAGRPASETQWHRKPFAWIKLVYGNDGYDLVSDYTTNLDATMDRCTKYAESLDTMDWNAPIPFLWG